VQNADGTLTMLFAGYRIPKTISNAGTVLGTNTSSPYTIGATDPAAYRNILSETLTSSTSPRVATQTAVTTAPASPTAGQPVTYTATVSVPNPGSGTPTGTVGFADSAGSICGSVALSDTTADAATCTVPYSIAESVVVTASYSGDSNYAASAAPAATPSNPYDASVLASSPSDYWSLDDSGTTVVDAAGTSNGSYMEIGSSTPSRAGVSTVTGATPADADNAAAAFNGGYADIPNGSAALTGSAFTLEFWAQDPANDCNGADYCPSLIGGGSFTGGGFYYLTAVNGTLYFVSSTGFVESSCSLGFDTTIWHQVAVTDDGSTLDIYVDGQLCGSRVSSGPLSLTSKDLVIGNNTSKDLPDTSAGPVDDVATYPRALPASEIAAHFAAATANQGGGARHPGFTRRVAPKPRRRAVACRRTRDRHPRECRREHDARRGSRSVDLERVRNAGNRSGPSRI